MAQSNLIKVTFISDSKKEKEDKIKIQQAMAKNTNQMKIQKKVVIEKEPTPPNTENNPSMDLTTEPDQINTPNQTPQPPGNTNQIQQSSTNQDPNKIKPQNLTKTPQQPNNPNQNQIQQSTTNHSNCKLLNHIS